MTKFEKALTLAVDKHVGQKDKGGHPFILHPLNVAMQFTDETSQVVGLLHDVVEDTDCTLLEIEVEFGSEVAEAVDAITRRGDESYKAYIRRCRKNAIAAAVKVEDLKQNLRRDRLTHPIIRQQLEKGRRQYWEALGMLDYRED